MATWIVRARSAAELSNEMRVEEAWVEAQLKDLRDVGLLDQSGDTQAAYRYSPKSAELERAVTSVAQAYLLHRVRVIEMIYSKPSGMIRDFADAFKLRKEPPHG